MLAFHNHYLSCVICFFLERIIEDHELVKDVISLWPKKSNMSKLVLKEMKDKHQMWTSSMVSHALQTGSSIETRRKYIYCKW